MCKSNGESPDHLLLHCVFAQSLWSLVFCLFAISWVMPAGVKDLMTSWMGAFKKVRQAGISGAVPHCLMWLLWRECNQQTFEGVERLVLE